MDEDIRYLKTLSDFTGLSVDELRDEWKRRKDYLERLRNSGVKGIKAVKSAIQEYYEGAEKRWKKM